MKFDVPNGDKDYMIFESIKSAPAKVIHVYDLSECQYITHFDPKTDEEKNEFRVGRSVETDMKIADISVSRVHSFLRIVGDEIILEDNGSKFGTLVKVNKPKEILKICQEDGSEFKVKHKFNASIYQIGRTMIYFKFYDQKSKLVNSEKDLEIKQFSIDPNEINLSYLPWKGTTFWRKTMLLNKILYIPREFVP
jgi:hypothetical protein